MEPGSAVGRVVLGVFPHPDDESWSAGGLLAACAAAGARVVVATATRGEGGVDRAEGSTGLDLGARREAELREACERLGVAEVRLLGGVDGALDSDPAGLTGQISELVQELGPDLVISLGRDGGYAHVDHLALYAALQEGLQGMPVRWLTAEFPRGSMHRVWRAMRRAGTGLVPKGLHPRDFGIEREDAALLVAVDSGRKAEAVSRHGSQLRDGGPLSLLPFDVLKPLMIEEWYRVEAGPPLAPGSRDPFAGLVPGGGARPTGGVRPKEG